MLIVLLVRSALREILFHSIVHQVRIVMAQAGTLEFVKVEPIHLQEFVFLVLQDNTVLQVLHMD